MNDGNINIETDEDLDVEEKSDEMKTKGEETDKKEKESQSEQDSSQSSEDNSQTPENNQGEDGSNEEPDKKEGDESSKDNKLDEDGEPSKDKKLEEQNDKYVRLLAEFENFRRRSEKEKTSMFELGARSVLEKILPVVDNFERALDMSSQASGSEKTEEAFMDGMEKIYKQLISELEGIGVQPIEVIGKPFDPNYHNAVMQEEAGEDQESGTVLRELQKGYMYRDTVIRHSMVSVVQ